ncbi:partner and localizer of BRCA2 [Arapaima gigas]
MFTKLRENEGTLKTRSYIGVGTFTSQWNMEESLQTVLHSDDKEMLRAKLALLQREYNRTVQRLRRAERSEAVRKHVRSRIAAHNSQQRDELNSSFIPSLPEKQTLSPVSYSGSEVHHKGPAVKFSLLSDILNPSDSSRLPGSISSHSRLHDNTPSCSSASQDGNLVHGQAHRRHSAHRLRSRRSWQRWEQREKTDSQSSDNGRDSTGQEDRDRVVSSVVQDGHVVSQALSCNMEAVCSGPGLEEKDKGLVVSLDKPFNTCSADKELTDKSSKENCGCFGVVQVEEPPLLSERPDLVKSSLEQKPTLSQSRPAGNLGSANECVSPEGKGLNNESQPQNGSLLQTGSDFTEAGCLTSCTVIEGLLFPVEYYVRTTRRMASAQSRVDLEAVIQSQLSNGRRGRGQRSRSSGGLDRSTQSSDISSISQAILNRGADIHASPKSKSPQTEWSSTPDLQPDVCTAKSNSGKRQRGRGRGRRQRRGFSVPSSLSLDTTAPEHLSADTAVPSNTESCAATTEKELNPIFCSKKPSVKNGSAVHCTEDNSQNDKKDEVKARDFTSTRSDPCESLLLQPSGPTLLFPQVFAVKRSNLGLSSLLSLFDIKDFHLPDDEFGRLKLDKLRSSATVGLQAFVPHHSSYITRWRASKTSSDMKSSEEPVKSLSSTSCQPHIAMTSNKEPTNFLDNSNLVNKTTHVRLTAAVEDCEAALQNEGNNKHGFYQEKDSKGESAEESSPRLLQNPNSGDLNLVEDRTDSQVMSTVRETTDCTLVDMGPESSPTTGHAAVAAVAASPHVLNLSPTPTLPCNKTDASAPPLWESPTFPSLGVTPAFPVHPSLPLQNCTPSASPEVASHFHQSTTPSSAYGTKSQRAVSEEPVGNLPPGVPCQTSFMEAQDQSHKTASLDLEWAGVDMSIASKKGYSSTANGHLHATQLPSLSDSFSASIIDGLTSQLPSPTSSAFPERCRTNLPQQGVSTAPSPLQEKVGKSDRVEMSTNSEFTQLQLTSFSKNEENIRPLQHHVTVADSPPLVSVQKFPEAEEYIASPIERDSGGSCGPNVPSTETQKYEILADGSTAPLDCQLTDGPEGGDRDLDSYFTDSVWPLVTQMSPPCRHSSPSQSVTKGPLEAPAELSHELQEECPAGILQLEHNLKASLYLRAPAGRSLVDVCGMYAEAGWYVVTAGEWAVSVWQETSSHWSLLHTWTFTEHPVITLLPVPDAPRLVCVALGQLEIREARVLSFFSPNGPFSQSVLCTGEVHTLLGVSDSRLASCTASSFTQRVNVSCLTEDGRVKDSVSLVSPGKCVQALALVEGQRDALIGSTDTGHLVIWNMRTGHLLQTCALADSFPGTVCLRGYTQGGVLFVLLQHQLLSQEDGLLFSLIAVNPVTGGHILAKSLSQPVQCSGRFVDSDTWGSSVVAAFQSGMVAVWDLQASGLEAQLALGPEEQCHIVRWAGTSALLTGHLNGDVSLYHYRGAANS